MSKYTMNGFKKYVSDNSLIRLDFRSHVYLLNQYGLTPTFGYCDAMTIVRLLDQYIDNAIIYNLHISLDELRSTKLKDFINEWLNAANEQKKGEKL